MAVLAAAVAAAAATATTVDSYPAAIDHRNAVEQHGAAAAATTTTGLRSVGRGGPTGTAAAARRHNAIAGDLQRVAGRELDGPAASARRDIARAAPAEPPGATAPKRRKGARLGNPAHTASALVARATVLAIGSEATAATAATAVGVVAAAAPGAGATADIAAGARGGLVSTRIDGAVDREIVGRRDHDRAAAPQSQGAAVLDREVGSAQDHHVRATALALHRDAGIGPEGAAGPGVRGAIAVVEVVAVEADRPARDRHIGRLGDGRGIDVGGRPAGGPIVVHR